jgi:ribonuclease P protein component
MGEQRLRPSERLRHRRDYQHVLQSGTKQVAPAFVLYVLPGVASCSRLGIAVSRRVGGAVVRNRVKRRARECFRQHKAELEFPCDIVVVARHAAVEVSHSEYARQFLTLLRRYQRLQEQGPIPARAEKKQE